MAALAERIGREGPDPRLVGLSPPTQLSEVLLPPMIRAGVPFAVAWERALAMVVWPGSVREERQWRSQLAATRETWHAAYVGDEPTYEELMAGKLWDALGAAGSFSEAA